MNKEEQLSKLAVIAAKAKPLREKLDKLARWREDLLSRTTITCGNGHPYEIRELEYLQTHWYVSPHGCTGGDYWNKGEGQYECPTCKEIWRLHNKPEIEALKHLFKSTKDTYDKR
jgi:Zn ribbon nucleic-acid-binding protein